ncbi:MAG: hypothetical protein RIR51_815 [Bacteroidota bacterium]|jgi:hypothetical protein
MMLTLVRFGHQINPGCNSGMNLTHFFGLSPKDYHIDM